MKLRIAVLAILGVVVAGGAPAHAQFESVGVIDFPTSATGEVQQHFLRGVSILHSFGWQQAIGQFQAAQELDPNFAMAYWGETLCYNHPLMGEADVESPRAVLARLAPTRAERLAKAPTDREKGLLNAVEILWGDGDWRDRRVGYMEAMGELREQYPDDDEIATFYAVSMLSAARARGDQSLRLEVRAGTIALDVFNRNRKHPGAAHYTIHSFDDPIHAPLALPAALAFAEIAPLVSHARHMPTHIFIQHGMWNYVGDHNQSAYEAARELWMPGDSVSATVHALDWGQYGDLQRGDYAKASEWIDRLTMVNEEAAGAARAARSLPLLKARYIVETEEWKTAPITEESSAPELLATGLSAVRTADLVIAEKAAAALKKLVESGGGAGGGAPTTRIMYREVMASIHAAKGEAEQAIELMDEAVEIMRPMRAPNGAANPVKPAYELYGEILLELDRPEEAIEKLEMSLLRMPNRPRSLLGLARAYVRTGDRKRAAEQYRKLTEVWEGRDAFPGLQEAKRFLHEIA